MKPIGLFAGLSLLAAWGAALAFGAWPPLMLVTSIAAVFGCLQLTRKKAGTKPPVRAVSKKFTDSDDALLRDCLTALEGQDWLTGTPEFEHFLQLATTDRWIGINPSLVGSAYRMLTSNMTPLGQLLVHDGEVTSPRQAHELARAVMGRLAHDAEALEQVQAWKRRVDDATAAVVAGYAVPNDTTWSLAGAGLMTLAIFLVATISVPPLVYLLGMDGAERLANTAPVFFGHIRNQMDAIEPGYLGILIAVAGAGLTGCGIFKLFARRQDAKQPVPFNTKLVLSAMAGSAAFLVAQPPVTHSSATAQLCSAMQSGFSIAVNEGPDARQAASDAYRSVCLRATGPQARPLVELGRSKHSDASRDMPPLVAPWEHRASPRLEQLSDNREPSFSEPVVRRDMFGGRVPDGQPLLAAPQAPRVERAPTVMAPEPAPQFAPRLVSPPSTAVQPPQAQRQETGVVRGTTADGPSFALQAPAGRVVAPEPGLRSFEFNPTRTLDVTIHQMRMQQQMEIEKRRAMNLMLMQLESTGAGASNPAVAVVREQIRLEGIREEGIQRNIRLLERQREAVVGEGARQQQLQLAPSMPVQATPTMPPVSMQPLVEGSRAEPMGQPIPQASAPQDDMRRRMVKDVEDRQLTLREMEARLREFQRAMPQHMTPVD